MKNVLSGIIVVFLLLTGCAPHRVEFEPEVEPPPCALSPLIVIDAGHGGKDQGTHSEKSPPYEEKQLTLKTAKFLDQYLKKLGYRTLLTRTTDVFIPLENRAQIANRATPRLFVSVHYNSATSTKASGVEVYYYDSESDKNRSVASKALAKSVIDNILKQTQAKSRGVKHGNYAVIRETTMPAILVEGGFLTNPEERSNLLQSRYLQQIAWGIAVGIDKYLFAPGAN